MKKSKASRVIRIVANVLVVALLTFGIVINLKSNNTTAALYALIALMFFGLTIFQDRMLDRYMEFNRRLTSLVDDIIEAIAKSTPKKVKKK